MFETMDFAALAHQCAPNVHYDTLRRIAEVESSFNPYAIGVVGGRLQRQPKNLAEAIATAEMLEANGYNYSLGLVQVNKKNFDRYGLTRQTAFDLCANLRAGGAILEDCYKRAGASQTALTDAFSCYYTGNFSAGYKLGYVARVQQAHGGASLTDGVTIPVVPKLSARDQSVRQKTAQPRIQKPVPAFPDPDPLFVSAPTVKVVAENDDNKPLLTSKGPTSALLF